MRAPRARLSLQLVEPPPDGLPDPIALQHPLFALLEALDALGSLQHAARSLGLSYRHCWGELHRWEGQLGQPLVRWARGQRAVLTPEGRTLLQRERLCRARLSGSIGQLQQALDALFLPVDAPVLRLAGAADPLLGRLQLQARAIGLALPVQPARPAEALQAVVRGRCDAAVLSLREGLRRDGPSARALRAGLRPGAQKLIQLGQRSLGLMLPPGNPDRVTGLADLDRLPCLRSPEDSAEHLTLAELRAQAGLPPPPEGAEEPCPEALAEQLRAGHAALAFGPEVAARAAGLDFLPLVREHCLLLMPRAALDAVPAACLLELLAGPAWAAALAQMPGCSALGAGRVLPLGRMLSWWPVAALRADRAEDLAA